MRNFRKNISGFAQIAQKNSAKLIAFHAQNSAKVRKKKFPRCAKVLAISSKPHIFTICLPCIYHVFTMSLPCLYHIFTVYLLCVYHVFTMYLPCIYHVFTI